MDQANILIIGGGVVGCAIARALSAAPPDVAKDATVAEMNFLGKMTVLRPGTNGFTCMPGDPTGVGQPAMCEDEASMQWSKDFAEHKPKPTNTVPGITYMLAGATQRSDSDPYDTTSKPIAIGPHWMILWPFDANHCGLPTTVRDAGAWIMFAGTPYAYLHVCGTPWAGVEYTPGDEAIWTMRYQKRTAG